MRWTRITRRDPDYKEVVGRRHSLMNRVAIFALAAVLALTLLPLLVEFVTLALRR